MPKSAILDICIFVSNKSGNLFLKKCIKSDFFKSF